MAGLFDLLKMLGGGGGGDAAPAPVAAAAPAPAGVASMLGSTNPDPMMTNGPQPQAAGNPVALAPGQPDPSQNVALSQPPGPITPPDDGGGVGGFLSRMLQKANARDPDSQMNFWDRLGQFGARTTDMAGDTSGAAAAFDRGIQARQAQAQRQQLNQMAKVLGLEGKEALAFQIDPEKWAAENVKEPQDPGEKVVSNDHGIFAYDPNTKGLRILQSFTPKVTAPPGYRDNGDGTYTFIKGGPADPSVVDTLATTRRKAVTANPMPSKAPLGNGGSWLPQGARVVGVGRQ